jgi:hypothetical protein
MSEDKRRMIVSERSEGRNFDIREASDLINVYADGTARVFSGPIVTKLEFFRVTDATEENGVLVEQREVFLRLTVPTIPYIEGAANILSAIGEQLKAMDQAANTTRQVIEAAINRVKDVKI